MNCNECNTKNSKDANYCKNCGKKLVDEVNELNKMFYETKEIVQGLFKKPSEILKKYINSNNYQNSIIYLALNIVIFSFLLVVLVNVINRSTAYYLLDSILVQESFSYFRLFLLTIILYLLGYIIFSGIYYLTSKYLFKNNVDFKCIVSWLGTNSLFLSCIYLLLIVTIIVSIKLSLIIILIGIILYVYNLLISIKYVNSNENQNGYLIMISLILTYILVIYVLPQLFI